MIESEMELNFLDTEDMMDEIKIGIGFIGA